MVEQQKPSVRISRTKNFVAPQPAVGFAASPRPVEQRALERLRKQFEATGRDHFANVEQNTAKRVADAPVSTFSIDVDTVSYSFVHRDASQDAGTDRGNDPGIDNGGDVAIALQPSVLLVDAARDIDRKHKLEVNRHRGGGRRQSRARRRQRHRQHGKS